MVQKKYFINGFSTPYSNQVANIDRIEPLKISDQEIAEKKIKKHLKNSIIYASITAGLLALGFFLNSKASIDQSEILQYSRSFIFALTMPFAIATTSCFFDYQLAHDSISNSASLAEKNLKPSMDIFKKNYLNGQNKENPLSILKPDGAKKLSVSDNSKDQLNQL